MDIYNSEDFWNFNHSQHTLQTSSQISHARITRHLLVQIHTRGKTLRAWCLGGEISKDVIKCNSKFFSSQFQIYFCTYGTGDPTERSRLRSASGTTTEDINWPVQTTTSSSRSIRGALMEIHCANRRFRWSVPTFGRGCVASALVLPYRSNVLDRQHNVMLCCLTGPQEHEPPKNVWIRHHFSSLIPRIVTIHFLKSHAFCNIGVTNGDIWVVNLQFYVRLKF